MDLTTRVYSVRELIGQFLANRPPNTMRNYWNAINRWGGYLHPTARDWTEMSWELLLTADAHQAKYFITLLREKELDYSTLNGYRAALIGFYDEIIGTGFTMPQGNPFRMVRFPRGSTRPKRSCTAFTENEASLLLSLPDVTHPTGRRDYAILACLLGAGLRRMDILNLTYDSLKKGVKEWYLTIRDGKACRYREMGIHVTVAEAILMLPEGEGRLFPLSREGLHKLFKRYIKQARLDPQVYSLHSCRKTSITKLLQDGVPHRDVMQFSGHSSMKMVEYYDQGFSSREKGPGIRLIYGGKHGYSKDVQVPRSNNLRLAWGEIASEDDRETVDG